MGHVGLHGTRRTTWDTSDYMGHVTLDMGHVGCYADVLSTADRRCSGRTSCEIRVPDAELEKSRPCLRELKTYLEITYRCLTGMHADTGNVTTQQQ